MPAHALKNSLMHWGMGWCCINGLDDSSTPNSDEGPGDETGEVHKLMFVAVIYIDLLLPSYQHASEI